MSVRQASYHFAKDPGGSQGRVIFSPTGWSQVSAFGGAHSYRGRPFNRIGRRHGLTGQAKGRRQNPPQRNPENAFSDGGLHHLKIFAGTWYRGPHPEKQDMYIRVPIRV